MSDIKFTSDGKKVVVVEKLNNLETIVQEIFIQDGNEIPSGENFVVKSLHDAPAISWKEKTLKELEERFERERAKYQELISRDLKSYKEKTNALSEKLKYMAAALKNVSEDSFSMLIDFICGNITHVVVKRPYYLPEFLTIEEFNKSEMYENRLRLISLFGNDDGTFSYKRGGNIMMDQEMGGLSFSPLILKKKHLRSLKKH